MKEGQANGVSSEVGERFGGKPYVVSADIRLLLNDWSNKRGFVLPSQGFFTELRQEFTIRMKQLFPTFELVTEEELAEGLNELVMRNGVVPLSLDRVYYQTEPRLDIARLVDGKGNFQGLGRRSDTPLLLSQFRKLKSAGVKYVALVDDVIFTGDLIVRVANTIERMGIQVPKVYAGIGIAEGVEKLTQAGRDVECVRRYDEVIDEICERDFYPGVPFSGRLVSDEGNVGTPYILPFGKPVEWASIPSESQVSFSRFCIGKTVRLFEEIERVSARVVECKDLDRKVITLPMNETRFVDALKAVA